MILLKWTAQFYRHNFLLHHNGLPIHGLSTPQLFSSVTPSQLYLLEIQYCLGRLPIQLGLRETSSIVLFNRRVFWKMWLQMQCHHLEQICVKLYHCLTHVPFQIHFQNLPSFLILVPHSSGTWSVKLFSRNSYPCLSN